MGGEWEGRTKSHRRREHAALTGKQRGQVTRKLDHSGRLRLRLSAGIMLVAMHATFAVAGRSISVNRCAAVDARFHRVRVHVVAASVGGAPRNLLAT